MRVTWLAVVLLGACGDNLPECPSATGFTVVRTLTRNAGAVQPGDTIAIVSMPHNEPGLFMERRDLEGNVLTSPFVVTSTRTFSRIRLSASHVLWVDASEPNPIRVARIVDDTVAEVTTVANVIGSIFGPMGVSVASNGTELAMVITDNDSATLERRDLEGNEVESPIALPRGGGICWDGSHGAARSVVRPPRERNRHRLRLHRGHGRLA